MTNEPPSYNRSAAGILAVTSLLIGVLPARGTDHAGTFTFHQGLVFVDCRLNDSADALCLIDTGANVSAINTGIAEQLKLPALRETQVVGTTGTVDATMVKVDSLAIHGAIVRGIEMTRRDIAHGATPDGKPMDVIVGFDFLRAYVVVVDFRRETIAFLTEAPTCKTWVDLKLDDGIPRVPARLNGRVDTELRIDTGASLFATDDTYINLTQNDLDKLLAADPDAKPMGFVSSTGVGGEVRMPIYVLGDLEIGGREVPRPHAIVQPKQGYFAKESAVGFFGNNLLEKHSPIVIDYGTKRLGLECAP